MNLNSRIPKDFYRLFGSKYMDYYMIFLVAIYEESSNSYSTLGLTEQECRAIINEKLASATIDWNEERLDEEGSLLTRSNMASVCLNYFESWGWLKQDFDETLNCYVVSFPEYSQLYVELFKKLFSEEESKERESVLAVYSYLFTYSSDPEKNNEILKSAWKTSKRLVQMLANMQEGMRGYFDELSRQKHFRGIQEVLIKEINNSDSRKYAILTTTDSFYRYKEAVKELLSEILSDAFVNEEAVDMLCLIEREFDTIERRYNKLIEQKTIFASRAAARIRYMMQEGMMEEDQTITLVNLLSRSGHREAILEELAERMQVTSPYRVITERSFYSRREREGDVFQPAAVEEKQTEKVHELDEFVLKPLYTKKEIDAFRRKNQKNGVFQVSRETVQSMEDLEKLFFVWQDVTETSDTKEEIMVGEDLKTDAGMRFSSLTIKEK
ncbi:MAG: hypothetical protein IKV59_01825 [Lachnospiraceae bacterium]|nr:hypothetical protein [Lachnospiraceae bacterium]